MKNKLPVLLRTLRNRLGLTQEQVASQIHVDRTTYCGYESGAYEPSYSTLTALSKIFGVQLQYFDTEETTNDLDYVSDITADFPRRPLKPIATIDIATEDSGDYNDTVFKIFFADENEHKNSDLSIEDTGDLSYSSLKKLPLSDDEQLLITAYRLLPVAMKNSIMAEIELFLSDQKKKT